MDAVDAAYSVQHWGDEEPCIKFKCDKMRNGKAETFVSEMNWETLKIGPQLQWTQMKKQELKETMTTGEDTYDL